MWTLRTHDLPPLWRSDAGGAIRAFTTRLGGVSEPPFASLNLGRSTADRTAAVDENRRRVLVALGLDPSRLATAGQVHGAAVVRAEQPGLHHSCDALVSTVTGLVLAVSAADCLPILYSAPRAVAAAHSGWRGTAAGIPATTLRAVCAAAEVGVEHVQVAFGPCIRVCCYEVGAEVAERFPAAAVSHRDGRLFLDVPAAARLQLLAAGLPPEAVADTGACTACDSQRYFSHRRDRGLTGRQWGVIART
jgi:YfiH family protein